MPKGWALRRTGQCPRVEHYPKSNNAQGLSTAFPTNSRFSRNIHMIPEEAGTRTNQDAYIAHRENTAGPSNPSRNPCDSGEIRRESQPLRLVSLPPDLLSGVESNTYFQQVRVARNRPLPDEFPHGLKQAALCNRMLPVQTSVCCQPCCQINVRCCHFGLS